MITAAIAHFRTNPYLDPLLYCTNNITSHNIDYVNFLRFTVILYNKNKYLDRI